MKVVLTTAPRAEGDMERGGLPFLGIGYIGSWLKKHGYEVVITDPHTLGWNTEEAAKAILEKNHQTEGVTANVRGFLQFPDFPDGKSMSSKDWAVKLKIIN